MDSVPRHVHSLRNLEVMIYKSLPRSNSGKENVMDEPLVSVMCACYNQVDYLADALESFLAQKTSFPFEILVNDDCSTDGTTELALSYQERYPDRIRVVTHDENQYSQGRMACECFLVPIARGRYAALCEGDDYWTDPDKLQRQFDIMEADPSLTACVHASVNVVASTGRRFSTLHFYDRDRRVDLADTMQQVQCFATNSLFMRMDDLKAYFASPLRPLPADGDHKLTLYFASTRGGMYYLDREMSAYRLFAKNSMNRSLMSSDKHDEIVRRQHDNRVALLHAVDDYTGGTRHEDVERGIDGMDYAFAKDLRDYRELKRRWPERLKRESFPSRVNLWLYAYARPLHRLVYNLYCRL